MLIQLTRNTIVDGQARLAGEVVDASAAAAEFLLAIGKARAAAAVETAEAPAAMEQATAPAPAPARSPVRGRRN